LGIGKKYYLRFKKNETLFLLKLQFIEVTIITMKFKTYCLDKKKKEIKK
jgi:hypothetical protein